MTNFEKIKQMSVEEIATAIYNGISSDPCDYCDCNIINSGFCTGIKCRNMSNDEIIQEWLESEAEE